MITVRIWDLPTRLFHWLLVACMIGLVVTGHVGGNAMALHFRLGYVVLTLLLFRLLWGCWGGHWSRWSQLALSPTQAIAYWRANASQTWPGHNPVGSWSVLLMLGWLLLQVGTGLVSDDDIANAGPLSPLVPAAWVSLATSWHKRPGQWLLLVLAFAHVLAIGWYHWRKAQPLVPAMWHGDKVLDAPASASRDGWRQRVLAVVLVLLCAVLVRFVIGLAP